MESHLAGFWLDTRRNEAGNYSNPSHYTNSSSEIEPHGRDSTLDAGCNNFKERVAYISGVETHLATTIQQKRTRTLEERYQLLRKTLAHYLLLQVGTFVALAGFDAIGPAMNTLTDMKAQLKVQDIKKKNEGSRVKALSQNLAESMGETFASDYEIETGDGFQTVKLDRCGCIESVVAQSEAYGLTKLQARSTFCGTCMSSYKKAAETLEVGFKGKLRGDHGCSMSFSTK